MSAIVLASICLAALAAGPPPDSGNAAGPQPVVYTTFYPTTYFAERIGGRLIRVVCPVPEGADPIFWKPERPTIQEYQQADLVIANGAELEKWIAQVSLPRATFVATDRPLRERLLQFEAAGMVHGHGREGAHTHVGLDGHTWLDPQNARLQAGEIRAALARLLPGHEAELDHGFEALTADLDRLDAALGELSGRLAGLSLLASHPAFNYLVRRYGWRLENLDLDPEVMPDVAALARVQKRTGARLLLWEAVPLPEIAARLAREAHLVSVVFSPCELLDAEARSRGDDYLSVMRRNIESLEAALRALEQS